MGSLPLCKFCKLNNSNTSQYYLTRLQNTVSHRIDSGSTHRGVSTSYTYIDNGHLGKNHYKNIYIGSVSKANVALTGWKDDESTTTITTLKNGQTDAEYDIDIYNRLRFSWTITTVNYSADAVTAVVDNIILHN